MWFFMIIGLLVPRLLTAVLYLFTDWFGGVFETWHWPILGFIFTPYTLLWYSVVHNWYGGVWGTAQLIFLVVALALDLSSYKGR